MKKSMLVLLAVLLSVCMLASLPVAAHAEAATQQDGLLVSIETVGDSFTAGDEIQISVSVQNTNTYDVNDISLEALLPEGLIVVNGDLQIDDIAIPAGETYSAVIVVTSEKNEEPEQPEQPQPPQQPEEPEQPEQPEDNTPPVEEVPETGESLGYLILVATLLVSLGLAVLVVKNKTAFKVFSLLLCLVMVLTMIPGNVFAADTDRRAIMVDKTISIDGTDYVLKAQVTYPIYEEPAVYTVTFQSNGGSEIEAQQIVSGEYAVAPEAPAKENCVFGGWFTDNGTFENAFDFNAPVAQDVTLYAKWILVINGVATGSDNSVSVYSITDLVVDVENNTATAIVTATDNCALIVRFIDEEIFFADEYPANRCYINDGLTYASHVVAAGSDMAEVTAQINGQLPEHFVAEAILIDVDSQPLCNPFTTIVNTARYEQFQNKTVYDFDPNTLILNFDPSINNNFGVLAEDVKVFEVDDVVAFDTDDDGFDDIFRIVDNSVALQTSDKVFVTDGTDHYLFKVMSTTVDGDAIVVTPADPYDETYGYSMVDFYQFLKVDMTVNEDGRSESASVMARRPQPRWGGIRLYDVYEDISAGTSLSFNPIEFATSHFKATAKITGRISANLVLELDIVLFGKTYLRCDLSYSTDITTTADIVATWGNGDANDQLLEKHKEKKTLKLGKVSIPFGVTGLGAFADIKIMVEWEITAGVSLEVVSKTTSGFKYNTKSGYQKVDDKENTWKVECKGHAEIKFGPQPSVGIEFLGGILKAGIDCFFGGVAEANVVVPTPLQGGDSIHGCYLCVDGTVKAAITVNATLKYKITDWLSGTPIDLEIINFEKKLFEFYLSLLNSPDSMFGGHLHGGIGSCPNRSYKATLNTKNTNGQSVTESVSVYNSSGTLVDTISGGEHLYLPDGTYVAKATIDGVNCEENFTINEGTKSVTLQPNAAEGRVMGSVVDIDTGAAISGATIKIYENSVCVATSSTDANGSYSLNLEQGNYRIEVAKSGYIGATQNFALRNGEQKHLETMKLTRRDEDSIMGGIFGTIKDGVSGRVVSGVAIQIVKNWNSVSGSGTVVAEIVTDTNGNYDYKKKTVMGVDFGLDAGNYTIIVSKEGYVTSSYNVTVVGGMDMQFNGTITPVGAENTYRIVLTWGAWPSDLDSHLNATYNGYREHIFYSSKNGNGGNLDVDDTSSYGPETVTIYNINNYTGDVKYSVHDFTNRSNSYNTSLSSSNAAVKVYRGAELLETFYVPAGMTGTVWNVFYIDAYGNIVPVNTFESISSPSSVCGQGGN